MLHAGGLISDDDVLVVVPDESPPEGRDGFAGQLLQAAQADQAAESRESPVQENPDSSPLSTKEAEEEVAAPNK